MGKWVDDELLKHYRYILSINDHDHLNDTVIKAMAHACQKPYEQCWYTKYSSESEIESAIEDGSFFMTEKVIDDDMKKEILDEFVAELARYVVRNNIDVDENFIVDYEFIYILVLRDMSYITSLYSDGMEAMDVLKSAYDDYYDTFLSFDVMYETTYRVIQRCIEHLRNDKVKIILSIDDVFNMKELLENQGGMEV